MNYLFKEQKIFEQIFYPFNDNVVVLPNRMRAYIDPYSNEFKQLTIEKKLCNIGFAITKGLDLYAEIKKDIDEHTIYSNYKSNAIKALFTYIDFLRETEKDLTEILVEENKIDLKQLVDLVIEEILLRYNERTTEKSEHIIRFTSIPIDYEAIIQRFNIRSSDDKIACSNYLLTSQETICKASICKDTILYLNCWKELLPKLSGYDLYFTYDMIFPADKESVYNYNNLNKNKPTKQLILNIPPEPWSGNILNSKLVLLSLNPGYIEHLNKNLANMFKPQMAEEIMEDKRKVLSMEGSMFDYYEPTRILGDYYWRKNILPLGISIYGEQNKEKIFKQVSLCQYLAYSSIESPNIKDLLPSQRFTKMVLLYLATSNKNVKFLVLRASSQWKKLMGKGLWNFLKENNRLLISKHYRNQCLSEKNIGTDNYNIIVEHLKHN